MLSRWITEISEVLRDPTQAEHAIARWGFAERPASDPSTRGVHFYIEASRRRRRHFLSWTYPRLLRALAPAQRNALLDRCLAGPPGQDRDWCRNASYLLCAVQTMVDEGKLSAAALALAEHEWSLAELTRIPSTPESKVPGDLVNPSITLHVYPWDLLGWLPKKHALPADPPDVDVTVAYWLDPSTLQTRFARVDAAMLAALKIASEEVDWDEAAGALRLSREEVTSLMQRWRDAGLLIRAERGGRT